jgi:AcrR family transcriptional regulator
MTDPHTGRRAKGRPRDRRVDRSLLDAALALLAEGGPDALTIDAVAARAGVARTTVYRRWSGKDELVLAVLDDVAARLIPAPNLGDTRTDLIAIVETAIRVVGDPEVRSIIAALVSELPSNSALAQRFRRRLLDLRRDELRNVLERGIARGELHGEVDMEAAADLLIGPVYYRLLLAGQQPGAHYPERIVDAFLRSATAATDPSLETSSDRRQRPSSH